MFKTTLHSKFAVVSSAAALSLALGFSSSANAGSVNYSDPVPAGPSYPGCLDTGSTGADGGISYEWTVSLGKKDSASFVNHLGAKSFNEPPPAYEPPDTGWTHTSNWVALNLTHKSKVKIEVERQQGVPYSTATGMATARNMLVPAIAVYSGWDNTSCEEHRYNNAGNFDWSDIKYITNTPNKGGWSSVTRKIKLKAGNYSIAIGGTPKVLETYPDAATCDPATDAACYAYTGRHGYRVRIKTSPVRSHSNDANANGNSTN